MLRTNSNRPVQQHQLDIISFILRSHLEYLNIYEDRIKIKMNETKGTVLPFSSCINFLGLRKICGIFCVRPIYYKKLLKQMGQTCWDNIRQVVCVKLFLLEYSAGSDVSFVTDPNTSYKCTYQTFSLQTSKQMTSKHIQVYMESSCSKSPVGWYASDFLGHLVAHR